MVFIMKSISSSFNLAPLQILFAFIFLKICSASTNVGTSSDLPLTIRPRRTAINNTISAQVLFDCLGNQTELYYMVIDPDDAFAFNTTDYEDELATRCFDENDIFGMGSTTEEATEDLPEYARRLDSYQPDHIFWWVTYRRNDGNVLSRRLTYTSRESFCDAGCQCYLNYKQGLDHIYVNPPRPTVKWKDSLVEPANNAWIKTFKHHQSLDSTPRQSQRVRSADHRVYGGHTSPCLSKKYSGCNVPVRSQGCTHRDN